MRERKAIVVVHGMGSQRPLTTIRTFVENIDVGGERLYSSPDRISQDLEARRFSYHNRSNDYYELYWADLVEEPSFFDTIVWSLKLLFLKSPSERARVPVIISRFLIIILTAGIFIGSYYLNAWVDIMRTELSLLISGIIIFVIFRLLIPIVKTVTKATFLQSMGDVLRYTEPSHKNIRFRNNIRQKGIDLLTNLHEAKDSKGEYKYSEIVVVGHSLGSIVAYDILTALYPRYQSEYPLGEGGLDEDQLKELVAYTQKAKSDFDVDHYQQLQKDLMKACSKVDNHWRVTDFITAGSPLTHASMVIVDDKKELEEKQAIRELPTNPPVEDDTDPLKFFYYKNQNTIVVPHHAAFFAMTVWTNIYFANDYVGGPVAPEFGKGVKDICLKAESSFLTSNLPFASHTKYWNEKENRSKELLNDTI